MRHPASAALATEGTATLEQVLALARGSEGEDADGERAEFIRLVESARLIGLAQAGEEER
ncbi:MAG: DUF3520 domain-containing protein [Gemmatimonadales bacterium]|nr:DUF3520 domain-containing protein [Gemmatimonadales bacterium]